MIQNIKGLNPEAQLHLVADEVCSFLQCQVQVDATWPYKRVPPERSVETQGASTQSNARVWREVGRIEIVISGKTIDRLLVPWIERLNMTGQLIGTNQLRIARA